MEECRKGSGKTADVPALALPGSLALRRERHEDHGKIMLEERN
jgi:hypothetical protein